ncbi:hypothetical protein Misp01_42900 [Microtetraspora sp. NBRC 13810]|uniref:SSI family serine proteinase inhibitor n=1 Tax=Microtetraspora sp. NBRC 13810 TaxID=3030990 RepID=UPI0024A4AE8E|nr:SSI family serine proteinase inhibitor [Microtetraspora sp. NBRC 13810]GLW09161.1 hypothetical protein Misp01_42900 [Microtetraspora sp. NBRC 13810]
MRMSFACGVAAAASLLISASPAHAAPAPAPAPVPGTFSLTVSGDENTWTRGVRLTCPGGAGNGHPDAKGACAAIQAAGGNFDRLKEPPGVCTLEHAPVTATAKGTWNGRPVDWRRSFVNLCELHGATGPVFRF